jgi:uncharacterized membrane protein YfcA
MKILIFTISFIASTLGTICGIGGGVIIKPALDAFGSLSVNTISFLSGCTVLSMTCYSVIMSKLRNETLINMNISTYLGIGAAVGGVSGKNLFQYIKDMYENVNMVGGVQSIVLFMVTLGTLFYIICKKHISTCQIKHKMGCILIGFVLGAMSSFLGIGGGPINLVVLHYFFSMSTKMAAQNSLYIILLSQLFSLGASFVTKTIPDFPLSLLAGMVLCGILGGIAGRIINKKIDARIVNKLFMGLMGIILIICLYNAYQYLMI